MLVIDVKESVEDTTTYAKRSKFSFPILLDDGTTAARYAPADVLPDLPRDEVVIASNLIIDEEGTIRFMSLLDTRTFDAKLVALKGVLDEILSSRAPDV